MPITSLPLPAVIVDLETTGGRPDGDRITEVALIEVDASGVREWSTLVNPERRIPPYITTLTGISDDMVAGAPTFGEIAEDLLQRLNGRLFVAHNVRFDYGFLRQEFSRLGLNFRARQLCSVKLSRALYPEMPRHNLDSVIAFHGIDMQHRHRALDDARAVYEFLQSAEHQKGPAHVMDAIAQVTRRPSLPPHLDPDTIDALPESPGVYLFQGEEGLLYVGKAKNIRSRVLGHFNGDHKSAKASRISQQLRRIEWETTAGELGALLREAQLVKALQPLHNLRLRRQSPLCSLLLREDDFGLLHPTTVFAADLKTPARLYGLYTSATAAKKSLREIVTAHELCLYATGLEKPGLRPCSARQLKRCRGWCDGGESTISHNMRLLEALGAHALKAWPFPGPVGLVEENRESGQKDIHIVSNWCWLGTARSDEDIIDILSAPAEPAFDRDTYRLLLDQLLGKGRASAKVIALPTRSMS